MVSSAPVYPEEHHRYYDEIEYEPLADGGFLLTDKRGPYGVSFERNQHWLLTPESKALVYCSVLWEPTKPEYRLTLCDIEVRPGYQGAGLAHEMARLVEAHYDATLWTTGSFTPEGARALAFLPVLPGHEAGVKFSSMAFVKDWENLVPAH